MSEFTALELEKAVALLGTPKDLPKAIHVFGDDGWFYQTLAHYRSAFYPSAKEQAEALEFLEGPAKHHPLPVAPVPFLRHDTIPGSPPCVMVEMASGELIQIVDLRL